MRGLLQRDTELATLERHLRLVYGAAGRVSVVDGPAGVGKSSLLRAAAHTAEGFGFRVLRAWGGPLEQQAGWGVVRQLLGPIAAGSEWAEFGVGAAALARRVLDPDPGAPAPTGDAMHAASHGLTWLAYGLAEHSPTLMVVDDVHWADAPSLRWLAQLSRRLAELPLGVLCAVRSGEPSTEPGTLAELVASAPEPPLRPRPLGPVAVHAIVTQRLPTADPAFAAACHTASAGNPFLLDALIEQVLAEGAEPSAELATRLTTFGPEQVARSIELQLSRLPRGATKLARSFAVLGRGAPLRQAAALADLDVTRAYRLVDQLVASGLLGRVDDGYTLTHPLVAGAVYRGLPAGERALLHRRAATCLAGERADVESVGLHLLHSEPAGEPSTVITLRAAAARANRRGAPESAATFLGRALLEPPAAPALAAELHGELGLSLAAQVRPGAREHLHSAVELAATADQRLALALSGSRALGLAGHFDDAIGLARRGLDRSGSGDQDQDQDQDQRGELELEMVCNMLLGADTVDEALSLVRRRMSGPPGVLWSVAAAWDALNQGGSARRVNALLEPALAEVTPPRHAESLVSTTAKFVLIANGELDTAGRMCDALIDLARPQGWLIALAHGSFMRAIALLQCGRIHDARDDAQLSFEFKQGNSPAAALVWSLFPLVEAQTELGALDDAEAALDSGRRTGEPPAAFLGTTLLLERRAHLRLAQHRYDEAHADLTVAADWWRRLRIRHPGVATWRVDDSEAMAALDRPAEAQALAREHLALAERTGLPAPRAAGLRALARTTDPDRAIGLLQQAVSLVADSPARLEHTRVLVDLGAALRRANQRTAAQAPLRQALDLAERGGMRLLAGRARAELVASGSRPRRSALIGIEALTPAERQVAVLAAERLGNREIAQRLYVTRRTVETHLTHAFAKLGISSRTDLSRLFTGSPSNVEETAQNESAQNDHAQPVAERGADPRRNVQV
jgi:DNA-binding CsgD family transcriptional regulator